jgi:hypothetical protein
MEKKPFEGERPDRFCFDGYITLSLAKMREKNEIKRGGHRMDEKELLEEIFELALQNDMNYLG